MTPRRWQASRADRAVAPAPRIVARDDARHALSLGEHGALPLSASAGVRARTMPSTSVLATVGGVVATYVFATPVASAVSSIRQPRS